MRQEGGLPYALWVKPEAAGFRKKEDFVSGGGFYGVVGLVQIERNNSGEILAVSSNVVQMNQLKADILKKAQESLKDFGHMDIKVPIGTLLGGELLHGRGPEIPVRITLTGNITADFASNFESAGINQTKHQIIMKLNIHIYTYLSGAKAGADLTSSVPIAETVIVGETPQFFATAENAQSKDS